MGRSGKGKNYDVFFPLPKLSCRLTVAFGQVSYGFTGTGSVIIF